MSFAEALELGRIAEREFLVHLAKHGHHALAIYDASTDDKGPRVYCGTRQIVAGDVLFIAEDGSAGWCEVKTKTVPGYSYKRRTWEHGVNLRLFQNDYRILAERAPLWLVVKELRTLPYEDFLPPAAPPLPDGVPDWSDYKRFLVDGPAWFAVRFDVAASVGRAVDRWDGPVPGWLWPRGVMTPVVVAA